jgi:hypothetical protein
MLILGGTVVPSFEGPVACYIGGNSLHKAITEFGTYTIWCTTPYCIRTHITYLITTTLLLLLLDGERERTTSAFVRSRQLRQNSAVPRTYLLTYLRRRQLRAGRYDESAGLELAGGVYTSVYIPCMYVAMFKFLS